MLKTLRSRVVVASVLWTAGLLLLMHLASVVLQHRVPMPRGHGSIAAVMVGAALMAAGFFTARRSLAPLLGLREKVLAVRRGERNEIEGEYAREVQPLIESLNELIADKARSVQRARAAAGDLAHSLKTPLAILAREADAARAEGNHRLGEALREQIGRMSNQIDYQLARARTAASAALGTARCGVGECAEPVLRAISRLHAERQLEIHSEAAAGIWVRVRREDLEEVLGNLLDNACKWARERVALSAAPAGEFVEVRVEDDGPGLPEELRNAVLGRGVRLDESAPGAGLGLSIVHDLVEQYGGSIAIEESRMGGAAIRVRLPGG
jgi:signal transduction histidine kinase